MNVKLSTSVWWPNFTNVEALNAASLLEFDAVIDPALTSDEIDRALTTAGPGSPGPRYIDAW